MAKVDLPLTGACHCGEVTYEITSPPFVVYACHCKNCQRIAGSAFAMSLIIPQDGYTLKTGTVKRVSWTADSGNERWGDFCETCGTRICHGTEPTPGVLVIRAGTLDDATWMQPTAHIWTASAQPWFMFADDDVTFEGQPPDYAPLVARFQEQGLFDA